MAMIRGNDAVTVGGKPFAEAVLANALNRVPEKVERTRQFPLGTFHGLAFGIILHPGGAADVYLEGQAFRTTSLSRGSQGPRAVMNALNRLSASYDDQCETARKGLTLAETQLGDYQARLGRVFAHVEYMKELTGLRDQLKLALSGTPAEGEPTTAELAEKIQALKGVQTVEAAPARLKAKPRVELVRRRVVEEKSREVEKTPAPKQEGLQEAMPEGMPRVVEEEDSAPRGSFRVQVRKSRQLGLF